MKPHQRKYDFKEKLFIFVVGILVTGMMGVQTKADLKDSDNIEKLANTSAENHDQLIRMNVHLETTNSKMDVMEGNQTKLNGAVGKIQIQVVKMCERNKLYNNWPAHDGDCK